MKRIIGYGLLALFLFILFRFVGGVIFSRPKNLKKTTYKPTPTPVVEEGKKKGFVATLEIVVFDDRDDNGVRSFGERGLDWSVNYVVGKSNEVKTVTTSSERKCFPTIFNWLYGGCSQVITLEPGQWIRVWPEHKKGWKVTTPLKEFQLKTGKNMVNIGVRRYRPEEKEENTSQVTCKQLNVERGTGDTQMVKVVPNNPSNVSGYRLVVDNRDLGWQQNNTFRIKISGNSHLLRGYVRDTKGNVNGGQGSCSLKIGLNMKSQPRTGTPTWILAFSLIVSPLAAWFFYHQLRSR